MISINDVKPGMIGLSGGKTFIQKAIEFFSESPFSHSFIVISGPGLATSVLETTSTIIQVMPTERKMQEPDFVEIFEPLATVETKDAALDKTYRIYAGKWYGYLSYLWFIYRWAMRKLGKEPRHMWKCFVHGTICSELVANYIYNLGGEFANILNGQDLNTFSPEEVYHLMQNYPNLFRYIGKLKPQTE